MIIKCSECGQKNRVPAARVDLAATCGKCEQPLAVVGIPHAVKPADFDDLIANSPLPVVVDFWAPWCGPCRMVAPEVEKLAAAHDDVIVVKLNTQAYPQIAVREGVQGIPLFAVYRDGKRLTSQAGYMKAAQLSTALNL